MKKLTHLVVKRFKNLLNLREPILTPFFTDKELLKEAELKVKQAQRLLEEVNEPELIDYAIYRLKAAEKRYDYLFRIIKNKHNLNS